MVTHTHSHSYTHTHSQTHISNMLSLSLSHTHPWCHNSLPHLWHNSVASPLFWVPIPSPQLITSICYIQLFQFSFWSFGEQWLPWFRDTTGPKLHIPLDLEFSVPSPQPRLPSTSKIEGRCTNQLRAHLVLSWHVLPWRDRLLFLSFLPWLIWQKLIRGQSCDECFFRAWDSVVNKTADIPVMKREDSGVHIC